MNAPHTIAGLLATLMLAAAPAPATAGVVAAHGAGDTAWGAPEQSERFSKTVPLPKGGAVVLSNISGDVVVTGGPGDQVVIDAVKRGRSADDLKAVSIEVSVTEGRVEVSTRYPDRSRGWFGNSAEVDYKISVPRRAMVRVKTVSGDVQLRTVDGEVRAESVSGSVNVSEVAQVEGLVSVSGDVVLSGATATGPVTLTTVSGEVRLRGVKAPSITGSSVSGDVVLDDVTCDRLGVKSISGELTFSGPLAKAGRYALKSHSGDIVFRALNQMGFEVNASSFSGDINSDVELTMRFGGERRHGRSQEIRGTFGDGAAVLELNTFSGDIRIAGSAAGRAPKK